MDVTFRHPHLEDAPAITSLIRRCETLDANSHYAQLLLCHHFSETCMLAENSTRLVGFVSGYRPPTAPDALFIWQVAVAAEARGRGIGGRLLAELVQRAGGGEVRYLEATITPSNMASFRLFEGFAHRHGAAVKRQWLFPAELFDGIEQHEAEQLFRIGPLCSESPEST